MLRLLDRKVANIADNLVFLPPATANVPNSFQNVTVDAGGRNQLLSEIQRLRGQVYLEDGAIQPHQLTADGLHRTPEDDASWHVVLRGGDGRIRACGWYLEHPRAASIENLRVQACPLMRSESDQAVVTGAVESDIAMARHNQLWFGEVGGWAVAKEYRNTPEGFLLALAVYALTQFRGGALCLTTATVRHSSATILRRLGGASLEHDGVKVPTYFDPAYDCEMELLRFDSRAPNRKYASLIEGLRGQLANAPVITAKGLPQRARLPFLGEAHRPVLAA